MWIWNVYVGKKGGWTERFVNMRKMKLKDGERGNRIANREREGERLDVHITS